MLTDEWLYLSMCKSQVLEVMLAGRSHYAEDSDTLSGVEEGSNLDGH